MSRHEYSAVEQRYKCSLIRGQHGGIGTQNTPLMLLYWTSIYPLSEIGSQDIRQAMGEKALALVQPFVIGRLNATQHCLPPSLSSIG